MQLNMWHHVYCAFFFFLILFCTCNHCHNDEKVEVSSSCCNLMVMHSDKMLKTLSLKNMLISLFISVVLFTKRLTDFALDSLADMLCISSLVLVTFGIPAWLPQRTGKVQILQQNNMFSFKG